MRHRWGSLILAVVLFAAARPVMAQVEGPCDVRLTAVDPSGQPGRSVTPEDAARPQTALPVHVDGSVRVDVASRGAPVQTVHVFLEFQGLFRQEVQSGESPGETWAGEVPVAPYAWAGVGLYRAAGEGRDAQGSTVCRGAMYFLLFGRNPLTTLLGALGLLLTLLGLLLAAVHVFKVGTQRGAGVGAAILLGPGITILGQQFGLFPLTLTTLAVAMGGSAVVVFGLGFLAKGVLLRPSAA